MELGFETDKNPKIIPGSKGLTMVELNMVAHSVKVYRVGRMTLIKQ